MLTLEDYDDNAYDPKEFNVNIEYSSDETGYKEAKYLRTQSMGKCLYYEMKEKVWHKSEYLAAAGFNLLHVVFSLTGKKLGLITGWQFTYQTRKRLDLNF